MSLKVVNDESYAAGESSTNGNRVIAERRGAVIVVREAVLKPHPQLCPNKKKYLIRQFWATKIP